MNRTDTVYHELARKFATEPMIGPDRDEALLHELLRHCFTPEEAEIALHLPFFYQPWPLEKVAASVKRPAEVIKNHLDAMVAKGVIRGRSKGYALLPVLPGMFENVIMDNEESEWHRDFARIASRLYETGYVRKYLEEPTRVVRSIPVGVSFDNRSRPLDPDHIEMMIRSHETMTVLNNCQCRKAKYLMGDECDRADRTDGCIAFGDIARLYIDRGVARPVDKNRMRSVVKDRVEKQLVFFAGNVSAGSSNQICTCCDCCCHMLGQIIGVDPDLIVTPPRYRAVVDEGKCASCGKCVSACNLLAHGMDGKSHTYDPSRCIGCGLCLGVCPTAAIDLAENPAYRKPAKNFKWLAVRLMPSKISAMVKGKLRELGGRGPAS